MDNDTTSVRDVMLWLIFDTPEFSTEIRHQASLWLQFPPEAVLGVCKDMNLWIKGYNTLYAPLGSKEFPPNVHLLTMREFGIFLHSIEL
jgi:hypothetical protein